MKKNDLVTLNITGMTAEGSGVGRTDSMAVFVPMTAVGDEVEAVIIKVAKNYAVGKMLRVITPSKDRVEPDCAAFKQCGGCALRHISYEAELELKRQRVSDCLKRIGGLDIPVEAVAHGEVSRYRNKAQYPIASAADGGIACGFFARHSHRIVPCADCLLQPEDFSAVTEAVKAYARECGVSAYDEVSGRGLLRHIYVRRAWATGETMVCLVINGDRLPHEDRLVEVLRAASDGSLKTVVINRNTAKTNVILSNDCRVIFGDGYISDVLCGVKVRLSALSFYQVNHDMAERLYVKAAEFAGEGRLLLDLYCGAGTIGLSMAHSFERLIGVEVVEAAVKDAEVNAAANGIEHAEFICADAFETARRLERDGLRPDAVVVDPPRKGLEQGLPQLICEKMRPERVVYVSCDPATLARDMADFARFGYAAKSAHPFDLFPRTAHVECVVKLERKDKV